MPMAVLLGVASGPVPWLVIVLANTHSCFIHSSARLNIGPLRRLLCDNRFHRIHHSREQHHIDHNFATSTPLWDVISAPRTFRAPTNGPLSASMTFPSRRRSATTS